MRHKTIVRSAIVVVVVLILLLGLSGVAQAATVPLGAIAWVTGPTQLPNGMLQYQVDFAEGMDFGAAHLTIVNGKIAAARFFDNEEEYSLAYPEAAKAHSQSASASCLTGEAASTQRLAAPNAPLTLHRRYVEAWNYVGGECLSPNCFSELEEYYTYDGTNVTAASYWALIDVVNHPELGGGTWHTYSGPTCTIGGVPAANVLATGQYGFVQQETGDHLYTGIRTRGYGTGYGIASFTLSTDPGVGWTTVDQNYHVHTVY